MSEPLTPTPTPKISRRQKILRGFGIAALLLLLIGIVQFWPRPDDALTRYIPDDAMVVVKIEPYTFLENFKGHFKDLSNSSLANKDPKKDTSACPLPKNPLKFGIDLQHTLWSRDGEIYAFSMPDTLGLPSTHHVLLALTNKNKFEEFLQKIICVACEKQEILCATYTTNRGNNSSQLTMADSSMLVTWDHEVAMFSFGETKNWSSLQKWARQRVENPDRKNCIEQHPDFEDFRQDAEEMSVFVNFEGVDDKIRKHWSGMLASLDEWGSFSPKLKSNGMSSMQMNVEIDSGRFVLSSSFHGDLNTPGPFAFLKQNGLSDEALDNLHSEGSPQVVYNMSMDMDTLYTQIDGLLRDGLLTEYSSLNLDTIVEGKLDTLIRDNFYIEKSWTLKELLTSLSGDISEAVDLDIEEILTPIQELHLHIGQVKGNTLLGNTDVELSGGIVQERGLDLDLLLEGNNFYESLDMLPSAGRQLVKTPEGYTLILGMKDGIDSVNRSGYKDDVDYFIQNAGYGEQGKIDKEIREVLQKNPVAFYVSLRGADYGPISKKFLNDFVKNQKLRKTKKQFDKIKTKYAEKAEKSQAELYTNEDSGYAAILEKHDAAIQAIYEAELSDQAVEDIANLMSHFTLLVNARGEIEIVLALDNTEDNPLVTIWQVLNRYAGELGMLD